MDRTAEIALVTGANKGIGRETARLLAERGPTVLLAARDAELGERAATELGVRSVVLDVTDQSTVDAAVKLVGDRFGRLDVLVNNAGVSGGAVQGTVDADLDAVRKVFDTNVFGVIRVTNAFVPLLRRSAAARIVNVSSGVGSLTRMTDPEHYLAGIPGSVVYPPSKTALTAVTVQYAKELTGMRVNAADPGACATDFTAHLPFRVPRTAADGAAIVVRLAMLGPDGPTGGLFDDAGPVPW